MNQSLRNRIVQLLMPYQPVRIGVFGSFARKENMPESDLDILISFKNKISLFKLVQIQQELSDNLGVSVDLITENSLKNQALKNSIIEDLIPIYG